VLRSAQATTVLAQTRVCSSSPPSQGATATGLVRVLGVELLAGGGEARVPAVFWLYDLIVLALFEYKCAQLRALELSLASTAVESEEESKKEQ